MPPNNSDLLSTRGIDPLPGQRDYRLHLAWVFKVDVPTCDEPLGRVAATFGANLLRALDQLKTPSLVSMMALEYGQGLQSILSSLGRQSLRGDDPEWPRIYSILESHFRDLLSNPRSPDRDRQNIVNGLTVMLRTLGWYYRPGDLERVVSAMLEATVVAAWTAFETLYGDLWIAALNHKPELGAVALNAEPAHDDTPEVAAQKRKIRYELPVWLLKEWDFDLSKRMGTLLADKWEFSRRDKAKDAYRKAFHGRRREFEEIFERDDIQHVAALRNNIVHQAGVADPEFVDSVKRHPQLSQFKSGQRVALDGSLVVECLLVVQSAGNSLLAHVAAELAKGSK